LTLTIVQYILSSDEVSSVIVKILARYLDAKLTVCQCSVGENIEVMFKIEIKFNVDFLQNLADATTKYGYHLFPER
jgi:hypothetical protein